MADDVELTIVTLVFDTSDPEQLLPVLSKYVVVSRGHPGCRNIDLTASATVAGRFVIIEKWESAAAQQAHFDSAEMVEMASGLRGSARLAAPHRPAVRHQRPRPGLTRPRPSASGAQPGLGASGVRASDSRHDLGPVRPVAVQSRVEGGVGRVGEAVAVAEVVQPPLALGRIAQAGQPAEGVDVPGHPVGDRASRRRPAGRRRRGPDGPGPAAPAGPTTTDTEPVLSWRGWRGILEGAAVDRDHDRVDRQQMGARPAGWPRRPRRARPRRSGSPTVVATSSTAAAISSWSNRTMVKVSGVTVAIVRSPRPAPVAAWRADHLLAGLVGELGDLVDLLVGEAGQLAEAAGQLDRAVVLLAPDAADGEQLVDHALELERPGPPLGIVGGDAAQPVRAHLHVGDLVGEHPVLAELEDRVARRAGRSRASC